MYYFWAIKSIIISRINPLAQLSTLVYEYVILNECLNGKAKLYTSIQNLSSYIYTFI